MDCLSERFDGSEDLNDRFGHKGAANQEGIDADSVLTANQKKQSTTEPGRFDSLQELEDFVLGLENDLASLRSISGGISGAAAGAEPSQNRTAPGLAFGPQHLAVSPLATEVEERGVAVPIDGRNEVSKTPSKVETQPLPLSMNRQDAANETKQPPEPDEAGDDGKDGAAYRSSELKALSLHAGKSVPDRQEEDAYSAREIDRAAKDYVSSLRFDYKAPNIEKPAFKGTAAQAESTVILPDTLTDESKKPGFTDPDIGAPGYVFGRSEAPHSPPSPYWPSDAFSTGFWSAAATLAGTPREEDADGDLWQKFGNAQAASAARDELSRKDTDGVSAGAETSYFETVAGILARPDETGSEDLSELFRELSVTVEEMSSAAAESSRGKLAEVEEVQATVAEPDAALHGEIEEPESSAFIAEEPAFDSVSASGESKPDTDEDVVPLISAGFWKADGGIASEKEPEIAEAQAGALSELSPIISDNVIPELPVSFWKPDSETLTYEAPEIEEAQAGAPSELSPIIPDNVIPELPVSFWKADGLALPEKEPEIEEAQEAATTAPSPDITDDVIPELPVSFWKADDAALTDSEPEIAEAQEVVPIEPSPGVVDEVVCEFPEGFPEPDGWTLTEEEPQKEEAQAAVSAELSPGIADVVIPEHPFGFWKADDEAPAEEEPQIEGAFVSVIEPDAAYRKEVNDSESGAPVFEEPVSEPEFSPEEPSPGVTDDVVTEVHEDLREADGEAPTEEEPQMEEAQAAASAELTPDIADVVPGFSEEFPQPDGRTLTDKEPEHEEVPEPAILPDTTFREEPEGPESGAPIFGDGPVIAPVLSQAEPATGNVGDILGFIMDAQETGGDSAELTSLPAEVTLPQREEAPEDLQDAERELSPASEDGAGSLSDIDNISDRMQASLIVSETAATYSENNLFLYSEEDYLTFENLTSIYNMKFQDGSARPLYEDLSFSVPKGSATAFISNMPLDVHSLLRATKNRAGIKRGSIKTADGSGRDNCPNLLYIENDSMITYGIPALHFLMMCLSEVKLRPSAKQEKLFSVLEETGLEHIALTDTRLLTRFQRFALLLITVAMSNLIDGVVLNPNRLSIDMSDEYVVKKVFALLHRTGKTILFAGNNVILTECVANRVVALRDGRQYFDGTYMDFVESYCEGGFSFSLDDTDFAMMLRERFPDAKYEKRNDYLVVSYGGDDLTYLSDIIAKVLGYGINPRGIVTRKKSFANAVERMIQS